MLPNKSDPERTQQLSIPMNVFNHHYERFKDALQQSFHAKPNSKYGDKAIMEYLLMLCATGVNHEGIFQRWRDKIYKKHVPTGTCLHWEGPISGDP